MRCLRPWLVSVPVATLALLVAQEDLPTLKVDVDVVNVLFSVRDKKGALTAGLKKEDFRVFEDGKEQVIKYFARETDLPLTLGLLVDVSGSQENLIEEEKHAALAFFGQVLRPKDMAFLVSFGSEVELLQDFSNSAGLLKEGLAKLRLSVPVRGLHPGPVPTASKPKGTLLFDAVYLAATEKFRDEVGRKAMVLITDGVDQGSRYDREDAIRAAHRADAIIYSIYYVDPHAYGYMFAPSDSDLKKMSEETGGRLFKVGKKQPLSEIFRQIQEEMRSQYALGYTPTNPNKNGGFRELEIKTKAKGYKVQARKGYYATANERR
ncbi:MAG: VWA domain-containing protein [Acidobacteria bacterium]|nr:VWA domain-containing protein [Acidobacteriota bacterium]